MKEGKRRRRLDADAARTLILDAAEKRLAAVGPAGIRLQEVAADAEVSHPTVLHHFGSREQLVQAVIVRALGALHKDLIEALRASSGDEQKLETILENVGNTLQQSGHARVIMWLALEGHPLNTSEMPLGGVVDAAHAVRLSMVKPEQAEQVTRDDTARMVVLAALALVGGAVIGPMVLGNAGLDDSSREMTRFRSWLAHLINDHVKRI